MTTLSEKLCEQIDHWVQKFPADQKQSAVIPALMAIQNQDGHLTQDAIRAVAQYLEMPEIAVLEVATFYSMFELEPVGRNMIYLCTNISCMLCGSEKIEHYLQEKLGVGFNETTPDKKFTLKEVECLGACVGAPMMQVNQTYHENLTPEKIDAILEACE